MAQKTEPTASEFRERMQRVGLKAQMVTERYHRVVEERDQLAAELSTARATIIAMQADIERLRRDLDFMHMASAFAPDPATRAKARETITSIIRDIDRSLTLLAE